MNQKLKSTIKRTSWIILVIIAAASEYRSYLFIAMLLYGFYNQREYTKNMFLLVRNTWRYENERRRRKRARKRSKHKSFS